MPRKTSNIIHVPKPPRTAFNPNRPASRLLLDQMIHVGATLIAHLKTCNNRESDSPITESQAGDFVRLGTLILHPHTDPSAAKRKSSRNRTSKSRRRRARA